MLFSKFWGIARNVLIINCYSDILKRKHMCKKLDNNNFYYTDTFFRIIIEAMAVILYIYIAKYSTIDKLQSWIGRSD